VLAELASSDILECHKQDVCAQGLRLVPKLLASQDPAVVSELVRLISALASDSMGRAYLLQPGSGVVAAVYSLLVNTPERKVTKRGGVYSQLAVSLHHIMLHTC
jgi:hypothetical protein